MSFIDVLPVVGPAADRAENMRLYGWLIGDWAMDATIYAGGVEHAAQGSIHFGRVLDGRAIQDVWILPGFFHGTTLRIYDPGLDAWHILWSDPLKQCFSRQIGRAIGADIVQEGRAENNDIVRWLFMERPAKNSPGPGGRSAPSANVLKLRAEFFARRVK